MYTQDDEGKGTIRCFWKDIREKVEQAEPDFFRQVEQLSPDGMPLYLVYLPYGSLKGDHISSFLPDCDGNFFRLNDENLPKIIQKELGYGKSSSPFGMVLEKELEYFVDIENENLSIPSRIHKPGAFFNYSILLNRRSHRNYAPNGILKASSGCRSVFMLPNIGSASQHIFLQRDFNIRLPAPKRTQDHWEVFRSLVNSPEIQSSWRSCLLYFSEDWVRRLWEDSSWSTLKLYLLEKERNSTEYQRFRAYYDIIFSLIQKNKNLKPNPYLMDTVRHLSDIALGIHPGFVPAISEQSLPVSLLQNIYVNSYGLNKYHPVIMTPHHYQFETEGSPVYYSLQQPTTFAFSPKSRNIPNALLDIRELMHILEIFQQELGKGLCTGTVFEAMTKKVKFSPFHHQKDLHQVAQSSVQIAEEDKRFLSAKMVQPEAVFPAEAKFLRGCVRIGEARTGS